MGNMAGHGSMPGMMSIDEIAKLEKASGVEFDKMLVDMMIRHHQCAIDMARTEQTDGKNAKAKALAAQIVRAQTAEIGQMQTWSTAERGAGSGPARPDPTLRTRPAVDSRGTGPETMTVTDVSRTPWLPSRRCSAPTPPMSDELTVRRSSSASRSA